MQELLEKLDERQSVSVAALGSALTKGGGGPAAVKVQVEKVEAVGGGVTVGEDLKVEVALATKTAEGAKELHGAIDKGLKQALALLSVLTSAQKELNPALEVVKALRVTVKGKVVTLKGTVSADVLEDALKKDE